jgi:hypothetical protein
MTKIMLKHIWKLENRIDFKLHFARYNGKNQPLSICCLTRYF